MRLQTNWTVLLGSGRRRPRGSRGSGGHSSWLRHASGLVCWWRPSQGTHLARASVWSARPTALSATRCPAVRHRPATTVVAQNERRAGLGTVGRSRTPHRLGQRMRVRWSRASKKILDGLLEAPSAGQQGTQRVVSTVAHIDQLRQGLQFQSGEQMACLCHNGSTKH